MGNLTRHPWAFAGAGLALHFGWVVIGGLVFDDTPGREPGLAVAAAELPLLIGSGMAFAGGIAGRRRAQARGQRVAFAIVAIAASLQAMTVVWDWVNELHGSEDTTYIAPWIVALLLLPVALATGPQGSRLPTGARGGARAASQALAPGVARGHPQLDLARPERAPAAAAGSRVCLRLRHVDRSVRARRPRSRRHDEPARGHVVHRPPSRHPGRHVLRGRVPVRAGPAAQRPPGDSGRRPPTRLG